MCSVCFIRNINCDDILRIFSKQIQHKIGFIQKVMKCSFAYFKIGLHVIK